MWGYQNVQILFQSLLCLLLHQRVIPCFFQHNTLLCIDFIEWCYFLCTCHINWSGTTVILGSLNIYHTTVVQTPCIHIRLSEDLYIVTLLHSRHVHFYCVWGSPHTWCSKILPQHLIGWTYILECHHWGMPQGHKQFPRIFLNVHRR